MIQFRSQAYIDLKKYDACVQRDTSSLPYAHSWYLNTVCEQWDCLVLGDYEAVWPLPYRRKFGMKYYFRPFGIQQLGIYSKSELSEANLLLFIQAMAKQVRFGDLYLNEGQFAPIPAGIKGQLQEQSNFKLPLNRSYEQVYEGFNSNLKRKIKKSAQSSMELFEHDGPEVLLKLFRENQGRDFGLNESFYKVMEKLLFQLMHKGLAKVYTVYGGPNQLMAGAIFLEYQSRSIFLFSATSAFGKEYNAMAHLINEYLIYHSDKFDYLDFEGSNKEGLARFYASFGAQEFKYPRLYLNRLPWPLSQFRK